MMSNINILIIDDNERLLQLLMNQLLQKGANVKVASNGLQGINMAKKGNFSIILVDYCMPEMNGIEVIDILSRYPKTSHIDCILMSSQKDIKKAAPKTFLEKPFDLNQVTRVIQECKPRFISNGIF